MTEDDRAIRNIYAYSPYGEVAILGPDGGNSLQYTGRENDGTGLYYYRARYYDSVQKQWISEDPIGLFGGVNQRAYVEGNPVSYVDPLGLMGFGSGGAANRTSSGPMKGSKGLSNCSCPTGPGYWDLVMRNFDQTTSVLPWWTHVPGLNPLTAATAAGVAQQVGGLTLRQAVAYHGTVLAANAYTAAAGTAVINSVLVMGSLRTGMFIGSMLNPFVIAEALAGQNCP